MDDAEYQRQLSAGVTEAEPPGRGPYPVGSTNMEVAPEYADIGDDAMHGVLLGQATSSDNPRFVTDILRYPEAAWITEVEVPENPDLYGPASGMTMPVATFVAYPSGASDEPTPYRFPYHDARYGEFEDMLAAGEDPEFADPDGRYPLIILAHGASAHGIYDVRHAHNLASNGYIVAVVNYGDNRTLIPNDLNAHLSFLRPLLTRVVLDSLLASETFGPRIDADNSGITGHSFGGFTALTLAGGPFLGNTETVSDARITAAVIAAPWVGGRYNGGELFAFGPDNEELNRVSIPVISFFGTKDDVTQASFILPAMKQLSGPTYVVELVDQPHVFEQGSWEDRDAWELLFFSAYLKHDPAALEMLRRARSMKGGNEDVQLFDYQHLPE
jgi:dienelactone hydrolase